MSQEQTNTYKKLLKAHDELYEAIESLGSFKAATIGDMHFLASVLDRLDRAEAQLTAANQSSMWKES